MDNERLKKQMDFILEMDKMKSILQMESVRKMMRNIPGIWL